MPADKVRKLESAGAPALGIWVACRLGRSHSALGKPACAAPRPLHVFAPIFANEVGAPLRRTLFRSRIWRPVLVRAGLLGRVTGEGPYVEGWTHNKGDAHEEQFTSYPGAVRQVVRWQAGGMRRSHTALAKACCLSAASAVSTQQNGPGSFPLRGF